MVKIKSLLILISCLAVLFFAVPALAGTYEVGDAGEMLDSAVDRTGVDERDLNTSFGIVVKIILSVVGIGFFVMMIYAGFKWMTARGNEEQTTKSKNTIIAALIGVTVTVGGYAITNLVTTRLLGDVEPPNRVPDVAGSERLGCCLDHVISPGADWFGDGQEGWRYQISTEDECQYWAENPSDADQDTELWHFRQGEGAAQCAELVENWNQEIEMTVD